MEKSNLVTAKSYKLVTGKGGWLGQVVLTSDGMFASVTDYGNFSFKWGAIGDQSSFPHFIISMNVDYFSRKILQGLYNLKRTKDLEHAIDLFAENILPELQRVLSAEIAAAELEAIKAADPVYLTVDTIPDMIDKNDLDLSDIQLKLDEYTLLHFMEMTGYEIVEDEDENEKKNRIFLFSISFFGKVFDLFVLESQLKEDWASLTGGGDEILFHSFFNAMQDKHWLLLVALCKKYMELNPDDEE